MNREQQRHSKYNPHKATTVEDLTVNWVDENGVQQVAEYDKHVLSKGSHSTVMFKFVQRTKNDPYMEKPKLGLRRYRKLNGEYKYQSKFNLSSTKQLLEFVEMAEEMFAEEFEELRMQRDPSCKEWEEQKERYHNHPMFRNLEEVR